MTPKKPIRGRAERGLVRRIRKPPACRAKVIGVDATGKGEYLGMAFPFRLVKAGAAYENEVGGREQPVLAIDQSGRRILEG